MLAQEAIDARIVGDLLSNRDFGLTLLLSIELITLYLPNVLQIMSLSCIILVYNVMYCAITNKTTHRYIFIQLLTGMVHFKVRMPVI